MIQAWEVPLRGSCYSSPLLRDRIKLWSLMLELILDILRALLLRSAPFAYRLNLCAPSYSLEGVGALMSPVRKNK